MDEKIKKSPQIRFTGFKDDWEQRSLSEVAVYRNGKAHEQDICENGDYIVVNSKFISSDGRVKKFSDRLIEPLSSGEITFVLSDVPNGKALAKAFLIDADEKYTLNQRIAGIRPNKECHAHFLMKVINRNSYFLKFDNGVGQTNLSKSDVESFIAFYPCYEEQKQIGDLFTNIDNIITLHQRKLELLKDMKKSMLQKMFPKEGATVPEIRFAGFTEDWEERKLGDVVNFFSGLTYSPDNVIESGGTFVLRSSNVKDGEIIDADNVYVQSEVVNSDNVEEGDIIVVVRNGSRNLIGKHAQIKNQMSNTVIGAFMTGIRSETPSFINAVLDTQQFNNEINKNLGATINQITIGSFKEMKFYIPTKKEECKQIGLVFNQLDNLMASKQKELDLLKNFKKSMLQKMFI